MIRIRLTHWTGATIIIEGDFKTQGMGRGGPNKFLNNMEDIAEQLSNGAYTVEIEDYENVPTTA